MTPPNITTYYSKSKSLWYVNVYWPKTPHTRAFRRRKSLGIRDEKDLAAALQIFTEHTLPAMRREYAAASAEAEAIESPTSGKKLSDLITWYIDQHLPYLGRNPKTIARYAQILHDFALFCRRHNIARTQQIKWDTVERWQAWMEMHRPTKSGATRSSTSKRDYVSVVRRLFDSAVEAGRLEVSPVAQWLIPKKTRNSKYKALTLPQLKEFLRLIREHCTPYSALPAQWIACTGWPPSDVFELQFKHLNLDAGTTDKLRAKTQINLPCPITKPMREIIDAEIKLLGRDPRPRDFVFQMPLAPKETNRVKKFREKLHKDITRCCERHGFSPRVVPYDLRKTFGTLMANGAINNGVPCPPKILQALMGHAKIETTLEFYVEVQEGDLKQWSTTFSKAINVR